MPGSRTPRIRPLTLARLSAGPTVAVEITPGFQRVAILHPGNERLGIGHKAAEVMGRRRRATRVLVLVVALAVVTPPSFALGVNAADGDLESTLYSMGAALALGSLVTISYAVWLLRFSGSVVIARRRADSPGFFRRNPDQLGVGALLAVVGGVVGFILGKLA